VQQWRKATEIDTNRKMAIAAMWSILVVFGLPGLMLTSRNDPGNLPLAVTVVVGGTVVAAVTTVFARRAARGAGLNMR
jgi:drug/metabolite transporter (DMT)-like permease